ncbi:solute carrier family 25 member 38 [Amylostereum chailletii]|nr:solute carrier family 25 member 38 [Amylostereum chailletii]
MTASVGQHLLSGALSGLTSTVALQPFDLLKTRLQQPDVRNVHGDILRTSRAILAQNGLRGLWRGTTPSLARNIPGIALYMTGLTQLRTFMATSPLFQRLPPPGTSASSVLPTLSPTGNLIAGAAMRVAVGFVLNPISVLKARYESNLHSLPSLPVALRELARAGPAELTRGFFASAVRDAPYAGLFVLIYEGCKREANMTFPSLPAPAIHSASAAIAGTLATLATHPFDVVKTKIQVRPEARYQGFLRTVNTVWETRGAAGFFDGASLRLTRKVLSSAIGWAVYEGVLGFVRRRSLVQKTLEDD